MARKFTHSRRWTTTDGQQHASVGEAEQHQRLVDLKEWWAKEFGRADEVTGAEDMLAALGRDASGFRDAVDGLLTRKRGKRAASAPEPEAAAPPAVDAPRRRGRPRKQAVGA